MSESALPTYDAEQLAGVLALLPDVDGIELKLTVPQADQRTVVRKMGIDSIDAEIRQVVFIDDYAHHPEELRALISGARGLYPGRKCTVIFQPHLFTRTRDFVKGFAESLELADEVLLLPIYPARELPIEGVTSQLIVDRMTPGKARVADKEEVLKVLENKQAIELVITAGAGDIDVLVEPIREILEKKYN